MYSNPKPRILRISFGSTLTRINSCLLKNKLIFSISPDSTFDPSIWGHWKRNQGEKNPHSSYKAVSYFTCRSKVIPSYEDTEVQILLVLLFLNLVSQFLFVILNIETLTYTIINYSLITVQIASNILLNNFSVQVCSMRTNIFIEIKRSLNTSNLKTTQALGQCF